MGEIPPGLEPPPAACDGYSLVIQGWGLHLKRSQLAQPRQWLTTVCVANRYDSLGSLWYRFDRAPLEGFERR